MENTMVIQLTNERAAGLIHELEELQLIKVLHGNIETQPRRLSEKYKGVFSKEDAESFNEHTKTIRKEWESI